MTTVKANNNIYEALGFEQAEAENLRIRSQLMMKLEAFIKKQEFTQTAAASFFGVEQPRISDLVNGKINKFTIDMLVNMLAKAQVRVDLKFKAA
ncbi:MAG: XRE family transcriptional regulator [Pseudomonadales bacterium]